MHCSEPGKRRDVAEVAGVLVVVGREPGQLAVSASDVSYGRPDYLVDTYKTSWDTGQLMERKPFSYCPGNIPDRLYDPRDAPSLEFAPVTYG